MAGSSKRELLIWIASCTSMLSQSGCGCGFCLREKKRRCAMMSLLAMT